jgi:hypothetical protein
MLINEALSGFAPDFIPVVFRRLRKFGTRVAPLGDKVGMRMIIFPVLSVLFLVQSSFAADYYVSVSGSDNSPGTEALPFRSPQAAANVVNPGDTVYIKDGTYPASTATGRVMNLSRSGTPGNMITFRNYPGHSPQIGRLPATLDDTFGFVLWKGASYIRFEGLAFAGTNSACIFLVNTSANAGSGNIEISGNTFDQCGVARS